MGKYLVMADKQTATRYLAWEYGAAGATRLLRILGEAKENGFEYRLGAFERKGAAQLRLNRVMIGEAYIAGRLKKNPASFCYIVKR